MAMVLFLSMNGSPLEVPEAEAIIAMMDMAAGDLDGDGFTAWVRAHAQLASAAAPDRAR